jgi:hypothetical protein
MSYAARPGTVPFRAIAHLETLDHGAELPTGKLAEAIGVSPNNLMPSLVAAVEGGVLFKRQKDHSHPRSPFFWSLVDHSEPTGAAEASRRPPPAAKESAPQGTVTQAPPTEPTSGAGDDARHEDGPAAPCGPETPPERPANRLTRAIATSGRSAATPVDGGAPQGMRIALWSDNELVIERAGQPRIVFTKDETRSLLGYLFRMEGPGE